MNAQDSEVFKNGPFFAIVACLDPAQSRLIVAAISSNSGVLFSFGKHCLEFREIAAAISRLCAGSRHATIAKKDHSKNFRILCIQQKKINAL
jgi:hypothetical protein